MENNVYGAVKEQKTEKKKNKFAAFMKAVFVKNIGLKILSIVLGAVLVVLAVAL